MGYMDENGDGLVPAIVIGTLAGYVEARLFNHIVVAVALVAGGAVRSPSTRGQRRFAHPLGRQDRLRQPRRPHPVRGHGAGRLALGRHDHRSDGARRLARGSGRVFVLLAVPTMVAASAMRSHGMASCSQRQALSGRGFSVSFAVALAVVAGFMLHQYANFGRSAITGSLGIAVLAYWYCTAG